MEHHGVPITLSVHLGELPHTSIMAHCGERLHVFEFAVVIMPTINNIMQ